VQSFVCTPDCQNDVSGTFNQGGVAGPVQHLTNSCPDANQNNHVNTCDGSTGSGGTGGSTEPPVCGPIVTNVRCAPLTQGYWKQHAGSFSGGLKLGNVCYTAAQLQAIFDMMVVGNGLDELGHQLIAAKLNVAAGAVASAAVLQDIADADARIGNLVVPPVGTDTLPSSANDAQIAALVSALDAFNQDGAACK
jgi:hypothetical protein